MFAIAFDMTVAELRERHPSGVSQAYTDIGQTLGDFGFERVQGSVYITQNSDIGNLMRAILALKAVPWFAKSVRDVRGFKVENWSNFTSIVIE
jgi:virulence-associated protein VapD